ncbi:Apoptosis inhibitor 5-like protein API5 [Camellia lanceoleosa]|uniref:Apoptosis inhibitor 5-like protein API5 n=1 Tax=Camellia lanceoleosa TaxID=1840588 RepID=A0ACC0GGX0_9ERIC|nr:Apoptosis inhibitor 5-like protein API5 [Camellia lanceoleosa]
MAEHNKAMASAKSDEANASVKAQKRNTTAGLRIYNNILAMTQRINLSWKEVAKASAPSTTTGARGKRPASATNVMNNNASKKGRGISISSDRETSEFSGISKGLTNFHFLELHISRVPLMVGALPGVLVPPLWKYRAKLNIFLHKLLMLGVVVLPWLS